MERGDISFLNQLVETLEEQSKILEMAFEDKDHLGFNKAKKFMMQIQKQISEVIK